MAYIGREPQIGNYQICDAISVVNGQAAYTMQVSSTNVIPESVNHMIVSLNGVIQKPGSSYTISSSTITFSSNLATGDSIDFIYLLGNTLDLGTPSDSTVTSAKLSGNLVTPGTLDVNGQELILDADADTSITADTDDQIDIKVAGADDFQITANTLTALSGSTIKADTIAETTSANGVAVDGLNTIVDAYSKEPIDKFTILEFLKSSFGLRYQFQESFKALNATGDKDHYYSKNFFAKDFGYSPKYSSIEVIEMVANKMLMF